MISSTIEERMEWLDVGILRYFFLFHKTTTHQSNNHKTPHTYNLHNRDSAVQEWKIRSELTQQVK